MQVDPKELLEVLQSRRMGNHCPWCGRNFNDYHVENCRLAAFIQKCEDAIVAREGVGGLPDELRGTP